MSFLIDYVFQLIQTAAVMLCMTCHDCKCAIDRVAVFHNVTLSLAAVVTFVPRPPLSGERIGLPVCGDCWEISCSQMLAR